jgi:hypothetical protein
MTCRIERVDDGESSIMFRLTGRIQREHIKTLRELFAHESGRVALDLGEVTLVDREVVQFLVFCTGNGIELRHAPDYLREWVSKGRAELDAETNRSRPPKE